MSSDVILQYGSELCDPKPHRDPWPHWTGWNQPQESQRDPGNQWMGVKNVWSYSQPLESLCLGSQPVLGLCWGADRSRRLSPQKSHRLPDNDVSPTSSVSPMKMTFICRLWVNPIVINILSSPRSSPMDEALVSSKTWQKQLTHCWNPHSSLWWFVIMWIIKQQFHQELIATF